MLEIFIDTTRDIQPNTNFYEYRVKTNTGKQSVSFMAIFFKNISEIYNTLPPVRTKTELTFHKAKL